MGYDYSIQSLRLRALGDLFRGCVIPAGTVALALRMAGIKLGYISGAFLFPLAALSTAYLLSVYRDYVNAKEARKLGSIPVPRWAWLPFRCNFRGGSLTKVCFCLKGKGKATGKPRYPLPAPRMSEFRVYVGHVRGALRRVQNYDNKPEDPMGRQGTIDPPVVLISVRPRVPERDLLVLHHGF